MHRSKNYPLLDHLVRAQHYRWGYRKTERLSGLQVHDHLELGRKLHWEIARLAFECWPGTLRRRSSRIESCRRWRSFRLRVEQQCVFDINSVADVGLVRQERADHE